MNPTQTPFRLFLYIDPLCLIQVFVKRSQPTKAFPFLQQKAADRRRAECPQNQHNMFKILKGLINGLLFSLMLYFSALFGVIYLTGPAIPLMFFNKKMYRAYFDFALELWLMLPGVSMMSCISSCSYALGSACLLQFANL